MFKNAKLGLPFIMRLKDSPEKLEKVLKPPQIPTIKINLAFGSMDPFRLMPITIPKMRQAKLLDARVAQGN